MKFNPEEYSHFIFANWQASFEQGNLELTFSYQLQSEKSEDLSFNEKLIYPNIQDLDLAQPAIKQAINFLHLVLGVSYYKASVASKISCPKIKLDSDLADFLNKTYFNGLQEFSYVNKLDIRDRINFETSASVRQPVADSQLAEQVIIPMGGGKDSLLVLEILKAQNPLLLTLGINSTVREIANYYQLPVIEVQRKIDPLLLELNERGAYNGHVPFSAILGAVLGVAAFCYDARYLALANERSANQGNTEFLGNIVNHQYSKTFEFERDLNNIFKKSIHGSLEYFSLLRPFSEIKIASEVASQQDLVELFSSCNANKKIKQDFTGKWCATCPKCCFVFLCFAPYVDKNQLMSVFGKNLLNEPSLLESYSQLCGLSSIKPLECVGEFEESASLIQELSKKSDFAEDLVVQELAVQLPHDTRDLDHFMDLSDEHLIPEKIFKYINDYLS